LLGTQISQRLTARGRGNARVTVRYRCAPATLGRLYVGEDHEFQQAWVVDLSQGGIGLLVSRPVPIGISAVIRMRAGDRGETQALTARVIHCTLHASGEWLVGCAFAQPLTRERLESLL
jgi:hypothetical protein